MNIIKTFRRFKANLKLNEAIKKADKAHAADGKRYYVLPTSGTSGKLIIMDRSNFRTLKFKHYIDHNAKIKDLERECFYCTAYKDGKGELTQNELDKKRETYLVWAEFIRKIKKGAK